MQFNEMLLLLFVLQPEVINEAKCSCQTRNRTNSFKKFRSCHWEIVSVSCEIRFLCFSVLADCILSERKEVCLLAFRLLRCLNKKDVRVSQAFTQRCTMSSFHCLDRISPSGRCKHSNVWKVRVEGKFCHFFFFNLQADLYCPYLWFSGAPWSLNSIIRA